MIWISLLSSTDCQTPLRTVTLPTDPLASMMPTAYLKLSGQIPSGSCTLLYVLIAKTSPFHKQLRKLALYCRLYSENQLGNSKAYESNYNYSTAVIIKNCQLYISLFKCTAVTWVMEKIQKLQILCPIISQTAALQTQLLPSLFMTKCQNNRILFHAFL